ncbi:VOC family protein [Streptomyces sp. MST-110588]|uniref:VOC family protein n=1 Tax=Streptomyces sp. MST-110588 TaxID=2833628 RepID=UPI001F5C3880|nr:VOC family protein [Streptomyces sp. MST-110588]UNO39992.1 VOC family protein [Streptomyces sp. MST-110588]
MTTSSFSPGSAPSPASSSPAARLSAFGMPVADMAASLAFYRRLGLDIPAEADAAPHAEVTLPGGLRLMWDPYETIRSFDPQWTPPAPGSRGATGLAFECADAAGVDRLYADLVDAGYEGDKEPWDTDWGQRYAVVLDPDGRGVDLFAPLPHS